jgi:eukaryotic-like serine/threonine-protein kinase
MTGTLDRLAAALADRYRVERELGQGGMATVYLAHDLRHERDVAIKVLHPDLAAAMGSERFLSEIRTTARLQHPHILPLLDSGEADGLLYYVMPYVTGETLRARIERERQLPVADAVLIAREVADALSEAHALGVVHRDIKPENILLQGGHALVADFGIALAVQSAGGQRMTQTGLSLGTPQYMSPEQAMGERLVDARSDIYALGAVAYEMLVGEPPFSGTSVQVIVARIMAEKPTPIRTLRDTVPEHVAAAVTAALAKTPADRFPSAAAFAAALARPAASLLAAAPAQPALVRTRVRALRVLPWVLFAGGLTLAGWSVAREAGAPVGHPIVRVNFDLPSGVRVRDELTGPTFVVSPAGDMIAYTYAHGNDFGIHLRRTNEISAQVISASAGRNLTFSPDGRWVAFTEGNLVRKVSVDGGETATLGTSGGAVPYGLHWSKTGVIYTGSFSGLWSIPATGGAATQVRTATSTTERVGARWPLILPGGRAVAYATGSNMSVTPKLAVMVLKSGEVREHELPMSMPLAVLDGWLVFVSPSGELQAVRFDTRRNRLVGEPVQLDEGVLVDNTAGAKASLSASGTLAYLRGRTVFQPMLVRDSATEPEALISQPAGYATPRFSPNGRQVAFMVFAPNATDIWIYDIVRNTFTRLTTEGINTFPEWTPDGRDIVFVSNRNGKAGIWRSPVDGSTPAQLFYQPQVEPFEALVSPDMNWLIYRTAPGMRLSRDIIAVALIGDSTEQVMVSSNFSDTHPRLSPNGQWLAYQSNETGRFEIYVRPFPGSGARIQVSDNGGTEPIWGRDGRSLYYRSGDRDIQQVAIGTSDGLAIGVRRTAWTGEFLANVTHANYDVAPDGRFLVIRRAGAESQTIVVHNWVRELRARVTQ